MNKLKLYLYLAIHDNVCTAKLKKSKRVVEELGKQYVKVRIESLDITGISKYQVRVGLAIKIDLVQ